MQLEEIRNALEREPFVPLQLKASDGTTLPIPFRHVAVPVTHGLLVFIGVKSATSRSAKSYKVVPFDRIEQLIPQRTTRNRKKAG